MTTAKAKPKVVLLCGAGGAGKDTLANQLLDAYPRAKAMAFADPLYTEVAQAFGVTEEFLRDRHNKVTPSHKLAYMCCTNREFRDMIRHSSHDLNAMTVPRTSREVLEQYGTEYRRRLHGNNYWTRQLFVRLSASVDQHSGSDSLAAIVTDLRFPKEELVDLHEHLDGEADVFVLHVTGFADPEGTPTHQSAIPIPAKYWTADLLNVQGQPEAMLHDAIRVLQSTSPFNPEVTNQQGTP